jgi:Flp pilus assembly protein TadB
VSRERAQRRAARLAEQEKARAQRERVQARRAKRRALTRRLTPRLPDRRVGKMYPRRTWAQRWTIAVLAGLAIVGIWWYFTDLGAKIALTALVVVALPALIVLTLDRRT